MRTETETTPSRKLTPEELASIDADWERYRNARQPTIDALRACEAEVRSLQQGMKESMTQFLKAKEEKLLLEGEVEKLRHIILDWFFVMEDKAREPSGSMIWVRRLEKARDAIRPLDKTQAQDD